MECSSILKQFNMVTTNNDLFGRNLCTPQNWQVYRIWNIGEERPQVKQATSKTLKRQKPDVLFELCFGS